MNTIVMTSEDAFRTPTPPPVSKNTRRKRQYAFIPVNGYSGKLGSPVGRNDRCQCGSGKKRKRCCARH